MPSRGDRRLVARDPQVTALGLVLDPHAFQEWLQRQIPQQPLGPIHPRYVRYKPGTSCLAAYEIECGGGRLDVVAKAYRSPATDKLAKTVRLASLRSALGPAAFVSHELTLVVTVFPHDLQLRALRHLMGASPRRVLAPLGITGDRASLHVLSYRPERRAVVRVAGGDQAVVRVYADAEFAAGAGRRLVGQPAGARIARTLARHPRYAAIATEWLEGEDGVTALASGDRAEAIGAALASLHDGGTAATWVRTVNDERRNLREVARGLADLVPKRAAGLEHLASALGDGLARHAEAPVLTHGDFAVQQVVFTPQGAAFTDLDEAAMAPCAADIASCLADLDYRVISGTLEEQRRATVEARFLDGYEAVRQLPAGLDTYRAAQLLRRAPLPFRNRLADWPAAIERIVDRCHRLHATARGRSVGASRTGISQAPGAAPAASTALDPAIPWLDAALDPSRVSRLLSDAPWGWPGVSVRAARVVRHKPGRRCLVAYELSGAPHGAVLGKTRAKGLDVRTAHLNHLLSADGFGGGCADGIEVPAYLGVLPGVRMWVQAAVVGESAASRLAGGDHDVARRLAHVIRKLQERGPQPARTHTIADELRVLEERLFSLALRRPLWRGRLTRLFGRCASRALALPYTPLVPAHRDFHPDQVLVAHGRLVVLDLDLYALAHPALDGGNCLAHVLELGLRPRADASAIAAAGDALREALLSQSTPAGRPAIDVFATLALARLVEIDDRLDHRRTCVEPLLDLCEQRLSCERAGAP